MKRQEPYDLPLEKQTSQTERLLDWGLAFLGPFSVSLIFWALCIWVWSQS